MSFFYKVPSSCQVPNLGAKWEALFGRRVSGFFVEVGAYDGESFSNTSCLADVGWSGLYIEPIAEFAERCRARHAENPNITVLENAVSDTAGTIDIYVGDTLTTLVEAQVADYEQIAWAKGLHKGERRSVPTERLDVILEHHAVPKDFDVLVVDVEGAEDKVFAGFDIARWRPKTMLIEIEDEHPDFKENVRVVASAKKVRAQIETAGYVLYFRDSINSLYVRPDVLERMTSEIDLVSLPPPALTIGLPTYNRLELLEQAIATLRQQTFRDFELLVSDNHSPDPRVKALCLAVAIADPRVHYKRQKANIGADNFASVLADSRAPLFMWAADDDLWEPEFLSSAVKALNANPAKSAWMSHLTVIDANNNSIRNIPNLSRFTSSIFKSVDLFKFIFEPEVLGKANLYYSVFRKNKLRDVVEKYFGKLTGWGNDMSLVYAFLCRNDMVVDDRVLFKKRVLKAEEVSFAVDNPRKYICPWDQVGGYYRDLKFAAEGTRYYTLTKIFVRLRFYYDAIYARLRFGQKIPLSPPLG